MVARRIEAPLSEEDRHRTVEAHAALGHTFAWLQAHYDELVRQYPDQWVAVRADGVADADRAYEALIARIDPSDVRCGRLLVEFLPAKPLNLIL
ncbi:MAG: hypothetical protein ACYDEB_07525 [Dehalococcoidia bacterium]